jgi:hypothetical protein
LPCCQLRPAALNVGIEWQALRQDQQGMRKVVLVQDRRLLLGEVARVGRR